MLLNTLMAKSFICNTKKKHKKAKTKNIVRHMCIEGHFILME